MDISWHDTNLALARLDDTWAVRSNKTSLALRLHDRLNLDHIEGGDTLCDTDNKIHFGLNSFKDSISCKRRRNIDDGGFGVSGGLGLGYRSEDGETKMLSSSLALVDTSDNFSTVCESLLGMEGTLNTTN